MHMISFLHVVCIAYLMLLVNVTFFLVKGPEICNDLNSVGIKLDYWVTGYGKIRF